MKRTVNKHYSFEEYDDHLCLMPNLQIKFILFFLSRSLILPFIVFIIGQNMQGNLNYLNEIEKNSAFFVFASLPSLFVLLAWLFRNPSSFNLIKITWRSGKWLLTLSALIDFIFRIWLYNITNEPTIVLAALDIIIIIYLLTSRRVKDVFSDFPKPDKHS